ncbi:hypothetical protein S83_055602, partial [Arachis hypogaea]
KQHQQVDKDFSPCGTSTGLDARDQYDLQLVSQKKYEPICAKWTTEWCAIYRWVEDWDYNKIIICN